MSDELTSSILRYTLVFVATYITFVYTLKLPNAISKNDKLVKEYYCNNNYKYLFLDWLLIGVYLILSLLIASKFFKINKNDMCKNLLIVVLFSTIVSSLFLLLCNYLNNNNKITTTLKDTFIYKWFTTIGFRAVIYDIIIVGLLYILYFYSKEFPIFNL